MMSKEDFLEIRCPECEVILIVDKRSGKVVETKKSIIEDNTGDRFEDAFKKVKRSKTEVEQKIQEARKREQNKFDRLNTIFKAGMEKAEKEGPIEKPDREIDLD
jgi:flagellar biosynthesis/type III secretory pathway protein FliH